ncbi:gluconokinase [Psychromonas antarctica]|uniref:gluconokinase n=1 Tax=Psychromonas antarctica TaxID=67573 RepID=UPI001EE96935|nr:gluconokinase [Psychromonas antarctica]MCG6200777.1 gluconokinase [Psychromonas antarctica]
MNQHNAGSSFVIMGVSSTGKSSVGEAFANAIQAKFIDGDDLHPKANIIKMTSGQPLDDEDRNPWLERINDVAFSIEKKNERGVIVCSALKKKYREQICQGNSKITFIFLHGDFDLVLRRMQDRKGHFMPVELLKTQFNTLEIPQQDETNVIHISIEGTFEEVIARCISAAG